MASQKRWRGGAAVELAPHVRGRFGEVAAALGRVDAGRSTIPSV
jgi:hypothetical protein